MNHIGVQLCMLLLLAATSCPAFANPVVINLREAFGVVPDDGADDTEALRRAVEAGLASNGPVVFEFEPGMYDLCTPGVYDPFVLPALANHPCDPGWSVDRRGLVHVTGYPHALTFRTVGQGTATLNVHGFDWSRSATRGGFPSTFRFEDCGDVSFENLAVQSVGTKPVVHGLLVAVDPVTQPEFHATKPAELWIEIEPDPGYTINGDVGTWQYLWQVRPDGTVVTRDLALPIDVYKKDNPVEARVIRRPDGRLRIHVPIEWDARKTGNYELGRDPAQAFQWLTAMAAGVGANKVVLVAQFFGPADFNLKDCGNITLRNITAREQVCTVLRVRGLYGNLDVQGLDCGPQPGGLAGSGRDACWVMGVSGSVNFRDCVFRYTGDDAINIGAFLEKVTGRDPDPRVLEIELAEYTHRKHVGDRIEFWDPRRTILRDTCEIAAIGDVYWRDGRGYRRVTFEREPAGVAVGDRAVNVSHVPSSVTIERCRFHDGRFNGIQVQAPNATITDCEFHDITHCAALIHWLAGDDGDYHEGAMPHNARFTGNLVKGCNLGGQHLWHHAAAVMVQVAWLDRPGPPHPSRVRHIAEGTVLKGLTLSDNRFVDNRWGAVAIANVLEPIVRDNLFVANCRDVTAIGIPSDDEWYDRAKHLLHFEWCRGGTVTGNVDAGNPGARRHMQRDCVELDLSAAWKEPK